MTATPRHVLSIDLGTGGPKVGLVRETGELIAAEHCQVPTLRVGSDDAEQDPAVLWKAVVETSRRALDRARGLFVSAIACVSQYSSVLGVDAQGEPTTPLILWRDSRGGPHALALYGAHPAAVPSWIEKHGVVPLPSGADSLSHMLHVKSDRAEAYARTHCFLEAMDFLNLKLTGRFLSNAGTAFMMLLTDNRDPSHFTWDAELIEMSGIDPAKLPELGPMRGPVGELSATAAGALGLPTGIPVMAAMNDTCAASLATGTFRPSRGGVNIGTTCQILAHMDRKDTDLEAELVSMPSPIAGRYAVVAENGLGGGALGFLLERVLQRGGDGSDAYADLEAMLSTTAPGSGGVLFLPWLGGAQCPAAVPEMRGGFINVSLDTTRADLVRSVLEGVAFNLKHMLSSVQRFTGQEFGALSFSGGGALSDTWAQVLADIFDRPIHPLANPRYANNLAAALFAFEHLGGPTLEALDSFCPARRVVVPTPSVRSRLDSAYAQFLVAFDRLQPICRALN